MHYNDDYSFFAQVRLGLKRKLEFPDGYFILPDCSTFSAAGIEQLKETDYEELVQARKVCLLLFNSLNELLW